MVRAQGAPVNAENLNRAMLAISRGEQNVQFSMDNAIDRLAERTAPRRAAQPRAALPMPAPATPRPSDGITVGEAVPQEMPQTMAGPGEDIEHNDAEMAQFVEAPQTIDVVPPPRRTARQALMEATPELNDPASAAVLPLPAPLAIVPAMMAPRLGVTLQRRALQQATRGGNDMLPPPTAGAGVPRIDGPSGGGGAGGGQAALPAPAAQLPAPAAAPRRQVSDTARQHRQEVRENTARARIEAQEARRIAAEQRRQAASQRARGNPGQLAAQRMRDLYPPLQVPVPVLPRRPPTEATGYQNRRAMTERERQQR
jgi:hypothetical protein